MKLLNKYFDISLKFGLQNHTQPVKIQVFIVENISSQLVLNYSIYNGLRNCSTAKFCHCKIHQILCIFPTSASLLYTCKAFLEGDSVIFDILIILDAPVLACWCIF